MKEKFKHPPEVREYMRIKMRKYREKKKKVKTNEVNNAENETSRRRETAAPTTKSVPKRVPVSFRTSKGERVSFRATKKVPKRVRVEFYAKRKKKKVKKHDKTRMV